MFDRNHLSNTETRRNRARYVDCQSLWLTCLRILGVLRRRKYANSNLACVSEVRNALVDLRPCCA